MKNFRFLFILFFPFFLSHCFGGVKNSGRVRSYEPGRVITQKSSYGVGILPEGWKRTTVRHFRTIAFYNQAYQSTIETDSFCDGAYDDATLRVLTTHLYFDLADKKLRWDKSFLLDNRGAYRSVADGKVDGVPIVLDTVVIKKDNCLFDFALVSAPSLYAEAAPDFETFFKGFRFEGDP